MSPRSSRPRASRRPVFFALIAALGLPGAAPAADKTDPSAEEIQAMVRYSHSLQEIDLNGLLQATSHGLRIPFVLSIRGNVVQFGFAEPNETVTLIQRDGGYELTHTLEGKNRPVPEASYAERVRGTDVLYEDLSMRFLYWPKAELLGKDILKNRVAYKLHIVNPKRSGPYSQVYIWVDRDSGALMKMEGFDWGGEEAKVARKVKMFEVRSGQKINGSWVLEKMNVVSYNPESGKAVGKTVLQLKERKG